MPHGASVSCCSRSSHAWPDRIHSTAGRGPDAVTGVWHGHGVRALVDLLVPPLCDGCGVRALPPWCATCDAEARRLRPRAPCRRCAGGDRPGHACWVPGTPVAAMTALSTWTGPVARTVLHAKLAGRSEVLRALGHRVAALVTAQPDVVVPVPTVRRRVRRRGLDHTRVLAAAVADALLVPMVPALRTGRPVPDRGAATDRRQPLPPDAFVATTAARSVRGRSVLLVDDVATTGATLATAARSLVGHGPRDVAAAVVARAGAHELG